MDSTYLHKRGRLTWVFLQYSESSRLLFYCYLGLTIYSHVELLYSSTGHQSAHYTKMLHEHQTHWNMCLKIKLLWLTKVFFKMIVYHFILYHNFELKKFLFFSINILLKADLTWKAPKIERNSLLLQNCHASEELHRREFQVLLVFSWF